jgi:hypothetical protein
MNEIRRTVRSKLEGRVRARQRQQQQRERQCEKREGRRTSQLSPAYVRKYSVEFIHGGMRLLSANASPRCTDSPTFSAAASTLPTVSTPGMAALVHAVAGCDPTG